MDVQRTEYRSLEECWRDWANVTTPPLPKSIFSGAKRFASQTLSHWLQGSPSTPFLIVADSPDEGLAALACSFDYAILSHRELRDEIVVVDNICGLEKLLSSSRTAIPAIVSIPLDLSYFQKYYGRRIILISNRSEFSQQPNFIVDPVQEGEWRVAMSDLGMSETETIHYAKKTGRSRTVLRRLLSADRSVREPLWLSDSDQGRILRQLVLAGAWNADNANDQYFIESLTETDFTKIEEMLEKTWTHTNGPIGCSGALRFVNSRRDSLYLISSRLSKDDVRHFLSWAFGVFLSLSGILEIPTLLYAAPEFAQAVKDADKASELGYNPSTELRYGIVESLCLLDSHRDELFSRAISLEIHSRLHEIMRCLLSPKKDRHWNYPSRFIAGCAEVAPETFLDIVEDDLIAKGSTIISDMYQNWPRISVNVETFGLIPALEILGWNEAYFDRVVNFFTSLWVALSNDLTKGKFTKSWRNRIENSLSGLFCYWLPQTTATSAQRALALTQLFNSSPELGWTIALNQFGTGATTAKLNARPFFRPWAADAGGRLDITHDEDNDFLEFCFNKIIGSSSYSYVKIKELLDQMPFPTHQNERVWRAVLKWITNCELSAAQRAWLMISVTKLIDRARAEKANSLLVMSDVWTALGGFKAKLVDWGLGQSFLYVE